MFLAKLITHITMLEDVDFKNKTTIYQIGRKVHKIRGSMAIHPSVM
jgi:hypothetical protein